MNKEQPKRYTKSRILVNFNRDNGSKFIEGWLTQQDLDWYCVHDFMRRYEIELEYGREDEVTLQLEQSGLVEKIVNVTKGKLKQNRSQYRNQYRR
jgi:hypothetical protein